MVLRNPRIALANKLSPIEASSYLAANARALPVKTVASSFAGKPRSNRLCAVCRSEFIREKWCWRNPEAALANKLSPTEASSYLAANASVLPVTTVANSFTGKPRSNRICAICRSEFIREKWCWRNPEAALANMLSPTEAGSYLAAKTRVLLVTTVANSFAGKPRSNRFCITCRSALARDCGVTVLHRAIEEMPSRVNALPSNNKYVLI
jgi:C4-dicarboxylate transporter